MIRRKPLTRKVPLHAGRPGARSALKQKSPMKRAGKKVKAWEALRASLKKAFAAARITQCEIRQSGCWSGNALGFAHSLKRRNSTTPELMREVCLACNPCHDKVEAMPEHVMAKIVRGIIAARHIQPSI